MLFGSPGCGACRVAEERLPGLAPPGVSLFKVDVRISSALARALDIFHLPALLLYKNGSFHSPIHCEMTATALESALRAALAGPPQEEP